MRARGLARIDPLAVVFSRLPNVGPTFSEFSRNISASGRTASLGCLPMNYRRSFERREGQRISEFFRTAFNSKGRPKNSDRGRGCSSYEQAQLQRLTAAEGE